jgi:hypothetical protein
MRPKLHLRTASLAPTTYDAKTRTIEVVLSTGAAVQRYGYTEKLDINGADLRGIVGKPVLDAHSQHSTKAVLGVIQKAWKAEGEIRALLKLSARDDVAGIVRDIAEGIIRNVSIGYSVARWADSTNSKGERMRTALAWKILEASFVPVGADPGAKTRSHSMRKTKKSGAANPAPTDEDVIENTPETETREEPTVAETRAEIRTIIKRAGGTPEQADELIDQEATVEQARAAAYEIMTARTSNAPRVRIVRSNDSPQAMMTRRQDSLVARMTGAAPAEHAREFMNTRLVDHARACLVERNVPIAGLSDGEIIMRAHTSSDFSELLTGAGNRVLLAQFEASRTPLHVLTRKATAPDLTRPLQRLRVSEMGEFEVLGGENSEIKNTTRSELKGAYTIDAGGLIFPLGFAAQTGDDLGAFNDITTALGQTVASYQREKLIALIEDNEVVEDGENFFSAAHGNIITPSGIFDSSDTLTPLAEAQYRLRKQTGLDGRTILNLKPKYLIVAADLESDARRAMSAIFAALSANANPFSESMEVLVDAGLRDGDWYVATDPAAAPAMEEAWLQGFAGPQLASQQNFRTLATEYRVTAFWGCGHLPGGHRGMIACLGSESSNSPGFN